MKNRKTITQSIIILLIVFLLIGCKKQELELPPQDVIINNTIDSVDIIIEDDIDTLIHTDTLIHIDTIVDILMDTTIIFDNSIDTVTFQFGMILVVDDTLPTPYINNEYEFYVVSYDEYNSYYTDDILYRNNQEINITNINEDMKVYMIKITTIDVLFIYYDSNGDTTSQHFLDRTEYNGFVPNNFILSDFNY